MRWMQRLKRVFHVDIERCEVCGGTLRVIACIETPLKCRSRSELAHSSRQSSPISPRARLAASITPAHRRSAHTWAEAFYQPVAGRLIAFPGWLVHSMYPNMAGAGSEPDEDRDGPARKGMARDDRAQRREEGGLADERISISFNFRQRRKDIDLATAPANEVVHADLLAR